MSESLNRAFIKAYDKERSSEAQRKASAEDPRTRDVASLFMQYDTTTISVPSPHFVEAKTREVFPESPSAGHQPVLASPATPQRIASGKPAPDAAARAAAELRESIALQMMQAGGWEDQRIDAFMGSVPELPELVPPIAPALSTSALSTSGAAEPASAVELESQLGQRERPGEIFRLDRPSYTQALQHSAGGDGEEDSYGQLSDSDEALSMSQSSLEDVRFARSNGVAGGSASSTSFEAAHAAPEAKQAPAGEARAKEADLRRARVRVFSPVWEVDRLQWSPVCLTLLEQHDGLNGVAENLLTACQEGLQVLAVISPRGGEGSTTVACCLGLLAGKHGLNVAIVDGDMRKPTLTYQTNLDLDQDWRSAILDEIPLEEIAVHSIDDQVTLLPLLNPVEEHELAVDDDRIASMFRELATSFDLVIIDAGQMDSARTLVASLGERGVVSAAVAVVDHRSSTPQRIETCLSRIRHAGIASIGLVENFAA